MENIKFKIVGLRYIPQNWMIRSLLTRFNLTQRYVSVAGSVLEHFYKKFLFHKMRAGTGCQITAAGQQRVAIARALAAKPQIILADEPTGNLDSMTSHEVMGLLKVVAKRYAQTIILITHDQDIAQMADRIVRIEDGRIISGNIDQEAGDRDAD